MLFCVLIISFKQFGAEKLFFVVKAFQNHLKRGKIKKKFPLPLGYPQDPDPEPQEDFFPDPDPQKKSDPKHCYLLIWPNYIRLDGS